MESRFVSLIVVYRKNPNDSIRLSIGMRHSSYKETYIRNYPESDALVVVVLGIFELHSFREGLCLDAAVAQGAGDAEREVPARDEAIWLLCKIGMVSYSHRS